MKKNSLLTRLLVVAAICAAPFTFSLHDAQAAGALKLRGAFNGFAEQDMTLVGGVWRTTITETANGSRGFLFADSGGFTDKWANGDLVPFATEDDAFWQGADGTYTSTSGNSYTFTVYDPAPTFNTSMAIQETTNTPISFSRSGQEESGGRFDPDDFYSSSGVANNVNTIQITLSGAVHDEDIYVRYSTDGFATSSFAQATGAGTSLTADIPAQAPGTTVDYYALTTTFGTPTHDDADLQTLNYNSNPGNGTYTTFELGDSFHILSQTAGFAGELMRAGSSDTQAHFLNSDPAARIYSGNVFQDVGEAADQADYDLYYKVGNGPWMSQKGFFNNEAGNDKYWLSTLDLSSVSDTTVAYYLGLTYTDAEPTFIYDGNLISGFEANAQTNPFFFTVGSPAVIPEPSSFLLMLLGAGSVLSWSSFGRSQRYRRRNR